MATKQSPTTSKPNILVIMGDDIGITNISAYSRGMMGYAPRTSIGWPPRA
jgi:arylsulfatase A-like enzyme